MNIAKITGLLIIVSFIIIGCSGLYGGIRKQTGTDNKVILSELRNNSDDYYIYYGKRSIRWADALMFDPKNSHTNLSGDSWIRIEDKETLDEKIKEIQSLYKNPTIYLIEGANKQFFGYMYYSGNFHIPLKSVDEQTLHVLPPQEYWSAP
jgi:hypothetical protein